MLKVTDLTVRYGALTIVDRVNFTLSPGEWRMLVGPNGAGKSTILSALSGGAPYTGTVELDGRDRRRIRPRALAREIGVLSQSHAVGYAFTVEEIVRLGRYAYASGPLGAASDADTEAVERALSLAGLSSLRRQSALTLSGGELQRTFLAQLFAQNPKILLLDEPTNHLDLAYQKQVFGLIHAWLSEEPGRAVLSVVHDLSLARAYGTHGILLDHGRTVAEGPVEEALSPARLVPVYGLDVAAYMREMLSQWTEETPEVTT